MKKLNLFLWFIALTGLITSCSRDEAAGPQNEASNRVRIGTSIDQALRTRAASVSIPANHRLRYVLEVWDTKTPSSLVYRDEKATKGAAAETFDFVLTEAGDYKALLWADFVPESETGSEVATPNNYTHYADHHYVTNSADGLKAVALAKTGVDYVINDDARDAFFACLSIEKGTGAFADNVELIRPFGQINVIEKNTNLLGKVGTMTLTYAVSGQFNVETGATVGALVDVNPSVSTLPTATADRKANLFYDFIFAPAAGQTTLGEIALKFESNDAHVTLPDYTIPANMPVVRNKRTNISGSILQANSNDVTLTVAVSDAWTLPDDEKVLPPKVGDYYFADGTWSSTYTADLSNPCIGIVFQTDLSRIGAKEKEVLAAKGITEPHGLVIAVKNAKPKAVWSSENYDNPDVTNCDTKEACAADINGLHNYTSVITYAEQNGKLASYPAFEAVKNYSVAAPANTTGWYLPSVGQWYDFFANLGGLPGWDSAESGVISGNYVWKGQTALVGRINFCFMPLGSGNYDAFMSNVTYQYFLSSSEFSNEFMRDWYMYSDGRLFCNKDAKSNANGVVRPVLAF